MIHYLSLSLFLPFSLLSPYTLASSFPLRPLSPFLSTSIIHTLLNSFRYKKQIEDAEEIAALNLAKFRKAQQQLEEADERAQTAEHHMGRLRHERGASMLVRN